MQQLLAGSPCTSNASCATNQLSQLGTHSMHSGPVQARPLLAVGLWSNRVLLYQLPDTVPCHSLALQDAQARSLVLHAQPHCSVALLAVGCSDGQAVVARLQLPAEASGCVSVLSRHSACVGESGVELHVLPGGAPGGLQLFAQSSRGALLQALNCFDTGECACSWLASHLPPSNGIQAFAASLWRALLRAQGADGAGACSACQRRHRVLSVSQSTSKPAAKHSLLSVRSHVPLLKALQGTIRHKPAGLHQPDSACRARLERPASFPRAWSRRAAVHCTRAAAGRLWGAGLAVHSWPPHFRRAGQGSEASLLANRSVTTCSAHQPACEGIGVERQA